MRDFVEPAGPLPALPELDQRHRALFEQTNDAVLLIGLDGRHLDVNQRASDLLGYEPGELRGKSVMQIVSVDEREETRRRLAQMLDGERPPIYERTFVRKDGAELPVEVNAALIRDRDGTPLYVQSIVRDISNRKREEQALRLIVEGTAAVTGNVFFRRLVRHLAAILGVRYAIVAECIEERQRARVLASWIDGRHGPATEYEIAGTTCEAVIRGTAAFHPNGVRARFPDDARALRLHVESYQGIPLLGSRGEVIGHLNVMDTEEMTDGRRAESILHIFASRAGAELERLRTLRALRESERKYRHLVEQIPAIAYIAPLDPDAPAIYVGPQIERVLGYSPEEWCAGESLWSTQLHPDDRQSVLDALSRTRATREPLQVEYRIRRKDGGWTWIREDAALLLDDQAQPLFLQGLMLDITDRKRMEDELLKARKLEAVGRLAGGIAHGFNNALMGILGNLTVAAGKLAPGDAALHRIGEAERAALRARGLTRQLLTFSEGGAPVRRVASIEQVIRETVSFSLSGSRVRPVVSIPSDLWPVRVDAGQIGQVIENLVTNAVEAMPDGGCLHVAAANRGDGDPADLSLGRGRHVRVTVRDEGRGIAAEHLDHVFDPYFSTREGGSGLGLAISYAIVDKHEGHISVESEIGRGTTFTIDLPAHDGRVDTVPAATSRSRGRILLMDDDEIVRDAVAAMLGSLEYRATVAAHGEEAIELFREALESGDRFDAAILDLTVPGGLGGAATMRRLLELDGSIAGVVSSGYSDDTVLARCRDHGFADCLSKPYSTADLSEVLSRVLGA